MLTFEAKPIRGKRTAQVLDLTVPLSLLCQVDEVIR
jgi:hypothetical protein